MDYKEKQKAQKELERIWKQGKYVVKQGKIEKLANGNYRKHKFTVNNTGKKK